jgi:hypothetical protein
MPKKGVFLPVLVISGLAAAIYTIAGRKLLKLQISVQSVLIAKKQTTAEYTTLKLQIAIYNPNETALQFKKFLGNILYKGSNIANIDPLQSSSISFAPRQTTVIPLSVQLPNAKLLSSFLNALNSLLNGSSSITVTVDGKLYAEKMEIPFTQQIKLNLK